MMYDVNCHTITLGYMGTYTGGMLDYIRVIRVYQPFVYEINPSDKQLNNAVVIY